MVREPRAQGRRHNLVRLSVTHLSRDMSPQMVSIARGLRQLGRFQPGPKEDSSVSMVAQSSHFGDLLVSPWTQIESFSHHELATTNRLHEMAAGNRTHDDGLDFRSATKGDQTKPSPGIRSLRVLRSGVCPSFGTPAAETSDPARVPFSQRISHLTRICIGWANVRRRRTFTATRRLYVEISGSRRRRLEHLLVSHVCNCHMCTAQQSQVFSELYLRFPVFSAFVFASGNAAVRALSSLCHCPVPPALLKRDYDRHDDGLIHPLHTPAPSTCTSGTKSSKQLGSLASISNFAGYGRQDQLNGTKRTAVRSWSRHAPT